MNNKKGNDLSTYTNAYDFIESSSGKSIINLVRLVDLMRVLYKKFYNGYKISEPKFFVLLALYKSDDGIPLNELGKMLLVSRANMTTLIERMVRDGYVEKRENDEDKRSTKAYLTALGKELLSDITKAHKEFSKRLVVHLDEEEKAVLNSLLKKMQLGIIDEFS